MLILNPGTGPVADASVELATQAMEVFIADVSEARGAPVTFTRTHENSLSDRNGRFRFRIAVGEPGAANTHTHEIAMPGLPVEQVRYLGTGDQNIWDFPRLYVDGSSWVWCYAVSQCRMDEEDA